MAHDFVDGTSELSAANVNSLDRGGNVAQAAGGGLFIKVSACRFARTTSWSVVTYAGTSSVAVTASQTNYVYLDTAGALTINTTGFPAGAHVPLAEVVCGASTITAITDRRFVATIS